MCWVELEATLIYQLAVENTAKTWQRNWADQAVYRAVPNPDW